MIKDFDHNYIILVNGRLDKFNLQFEDKEKVKLEGINFLENCNYNDETNLSSLNKALSVGGFYLEIKKIISVKNQ